MRPTYYAQALAGVLAGKEERDLKGILVRLKEVLRLRGHQKLLPAIMRACTLELIKRERASIVTMRTVSGASQKEILEQYGEMLPKEYTLRAVADPALASGFVLETQHRRIDASGKRALRELYQKILVQ